MLLYINEVVFYSQRPFVQFVLGGVFQRHPRLKFVITEAGCSWMPPLLDQLDRVIRGANAGGIGEIRYGDDERVALTASECFEQSCWMGVSQPGPADAAARDRIGLDRFMWGSDYPHDEGTYPHTREHLRSRFHDMAPADLHRILAVNAAELYGFDLDALAPLAEQFGPTVAEIAEPLTDLPENPSQGLSKDFDARAL
jgi:predicted TIM-barrel fold metal-dependent hydrolase